jgi:flagellar hook-length control protein FliK
MSVIDSITKAPSPMLGENKQLKSEIVFTDFFKYQLNMNMNFSNLSDVASPRTNSSIPENNLVNDNHNDDRLNNYDGLPKEYSLNNSHQKNDDIERRRAGEEHLNQISIRNDRSDYNRTSDIHEKDIPEQNATTHLDQLASKTFSKGTVDNSTTVSQPNNKSSKGGDNTEDASSLTMGTEESANINTVSDEDTSILKAPNGSLLLAVAEINKGNFKINLTAGNTEKQTSTENLNGINTKEAGTIKNKTINPISSNEPLLGKATSPEQGTQSANGKNNVSGKSSLENSPSTSANHNKSDTLSGINKSSSSITLEPVSTQGTKNLDVSSRPMSFKNTQSQDLDKTQIGSPITLPTQSQTSLIKTSSVPLDNTLASADIEKTKITTGQNSIRETTQINQQTETKTSGVKLGQLTDDLTIVQKDNKTIASRISNAAGNNILQAQSAQNSGQVNENSLSAVQRNILPQQVQPSQTNSPAPIHVGANTGENSNNANTQGNGQQSTAFNSNPGAQANKVLPQDAETFKQSTIKAEAMGTRAPATTALRPSSLASQGASAPVPATSTNFSPAPAAGSDFSSNKLTANSQDNRPTSSTNQVSIQLSKAVQSGDSKIKIQLHPQELGRVEVKLEIANDGRAKALISVERPDTLDILQRDSRILERALQEAGLKTDQNSLSFNLEGKEGDTNTQEASSDQKNNQEEPGIEPNNETIDTDSNLISATAIGMTPDGAVNLLA